MFQRSPGAVLFVSVMMMFHCAVYAHAQSGGTVTRVGSANCRGKLR